MWVWPSLGSPLMGEGSGMCVLGGGGKPGYFRRGGGGGESEGCGYGGVQCACVEREWEVLYLGEGVCVCVWRKFLLFCSKFMRTECLNSRFVFDTPLPISRLVEAVGDSIQTPLPSALLYSSPQ